MPLTPRDVVWSIAVPAAIVMTVTLAAGLLCKRRLTVATAFAVGMSFLVAFPAFVGGNTWRIPAIPPTDSTGWLFVAGVLAAILAIVDSSVRIPWAARLIAVIGTSAIGLGLLLKFKFRNEIWTAGHGAMIIAVFAVAAGIWWAAIEDLADRHPISAPVTMWLCGSCVAVVSMLVGILSYGKYSLILAAGAIALLPAMLWRGAPGVLRGACLFFSIMTVTLLAGELFLSEIGVMLIAILFSTPLFILAGRWVTRSASRGMRASARIVIALIPLATAVAIAAVRFHHNEQYQHESGYNY